MAEIRFKERSLTINEPQTVLEGLEAAGFKIPNSCRAGLCQSCLMQSDVPPPPTSQRGLSHSQKVQNYFLACSCVPARDMSVSLTSENVNLQGVVVAKQKLNASVLALYIQVDCRWFPGQYLTVWYDDQQGRPYSIAALCDHNKIIELHIKRHEHGLVSRWLHDEVAVGQTVTLSKPLGNCFYGDEHRGKPLLMVATGTGLAPLLGILREALLKRHSAPIYLYAAAGEPDQLYYREEMKALADAEENFHYIPVVRRHKESDGELVEQDVVELVSKRHPDLSGWKVFLCGSEDMIKQLQRYAFFQGASPRDILIDAFTVKKP